MPLSVQVDFTRCCSHLVYDTVQTSVSYTELAYDIMMIPCNVYNQCLKKHTLSLCLCLSVSLSHAVAFPIVPTMFYFPFMVNTTEKRILIYVWRM